MRAMARRPHTATSPRGASLAMRAWTPTRERAPLLSARAGDGARASATVTRDGDADEELGRDGTTTTSTTGERRARADDGVGGGMTMRGVIGVVALAGVAVSAVVARGGGAGGARSALGAPSANANGKPKIAAVAKAYSHNAEGRVDPLAVAAAMDPVRHAYLPDAFHGYDPRRNVTEYAHPPAVTKSKTGYTLCVDIARDAWDSTYTKGFGALFEPGSCFENVVAGNCDNSIESRRADVRVFSQSAYLWRGAHKGPHGEFNKPDKVNDGQIDLYFAHEAAGTFGGELRKDHLMKKFDYIGYFDRTRSAFWWPFGPTLNSMTESFPAYTIPHSRRTPGVAWIAIDCLPPRPAILWEISQRFPVFSMGSCANNAMKPAKLPGRGIDNLDYQMSMANLMFYFAMENAPLCEGYMTEKIWLALQRGSIPIYAATDSMRELMPSKKSFIDLTQYPDVDSLVHELALIARNETRYREYTDWRYQHPKTWQPGFRQLLRVMSSDIKVGLCAILQKGPSEFPTAKSQGGCVGYQTKILGRIAGQGFRTGKGSNLGLRNAVDFLDELDCASRKTINRPEQDDIENGAGSPRRRQGPRGDRCYRLKDHAMKVAGVMNRADAPGKVVVQTEQHEKLAKGKGDNQPAVETPKAQQTTAAKAQAPKATTPQQKPAAQPVKATLQNPNTEPKQSTTPRIWHGLEEWIPPKSKQQQQPANASPRPTTEPSQTNTTTASQKTKDA